MPKIQIKVAYGRIALYLMRDSMPPSVITLYPY
jgi:hypothetical protein